MISTAVIGGGPAGMLAASFAAMGGSATVLFERNEKLGKKLYITGKGRCNLTNAADIDAIMRNIPRNPKFLFSALYGFTNDDIVALIEKEGVLTKVERGNRVFPASDKSSDVIRALTSFLKRSGAAIELNSRVTAIEKQESGLMLTANGRKHTFDNVILAAGGVSYPLTGSTGDGFALAKSLGHTVTELRPSLVPLTTVEKWPRELAGLTLKNVTLTAQKGKKKIFSDMGELLFTHDGITGPLVLSASARIASSPEGTAIYIDLKPAMDAQELDRRALRAFEGNINRHIGNALCDMLPSSMAPVIADIAGIPRETPVNSVTKEQRTALVAVMKQLPLTVACAHPIEEAVITRGGIPVSEIDPQTMRSKLVPGLYFAGEMIDVDGFTGGFNLQIAYSTGALAGRSVNEL